MAELQEVRSTMNSTPPRQMPLNQPTTVQSAIGDVDRIILECRALRAYRWSMEWPQSHADRPAMPRHVAEFEHAHGQLPASAERVLFGQTHPQM